MYIMSNTSAPKKVLFTAVKNEGPFLLEWVAYHRTIGFDTIIVVSNNCEDGTVELLNSLHKVGLVNHFTHNLDEGFSPQGEAAKIVNASGIIRDGDWVLWIDADEFLNIHVGDGMLDELIKTIGSAQGMLIPWRIFGDSGQKHFKSRFISSDFTQAAEINFSGHDNIKTIYKHKDGATTLSSIAIHRPHLISSGFTADDFLNGRGLPIRANYPINERWLSGAQGLANFRTAPGDYVWETAQINHYIVRTRELFELKKTRGRGYQRPKMNQRIRHTDEFFDEFNRNDATDCSILRFANATDLLISEYLIDPAISAAHQYTVDKTQERVHELVKPSSNNKSTTARNPKISLPESEAQFVKKMYEKTDVILEYGSGGSTIMAAKQNHSLVMSVESDAEWAENMKNVLSRDYPLAPVHIHWADIGPTKKWGRPQNSRAWKKFHNYPLEIWDQDYFKHPDLVFVDGRFRIACFMTTLFRISKPVKLLFDDYLPRPEYAVVEQYVKPTKMIGRMAVFDLDPMQFPITDMTKIFGWYTQTN